MIGKQFELNICAFGKSVYEGKTLMYISPPRDYRFRLVQILENGKPGDAICSSIMTSCLEMKAVMPTIRKTRSRVRACKSRWKDGKVVVSDRE